MFQGRARRPAQPIARRSSLNSLSSSSSTGIEGMSGFVGIGLGSSMSSSLLSGISLLPLSNSSRNFRVLSPQITCDRVPANQLPVTRKCGAPTVQRLAARNQNYGVPAIQLHATLKILPHHSFSRKCLARRKGKRGGGGGKDL